MAKTMKEIYAGLNVHVGFFPQDVATVFTFMGVVIPRDPVKGAVMAEVIYNQLRIEKMNGKTFKNLKKEVEGLRMVHG